MNSCIYAQWLIRYGIHVWCVELIRYRLLHLLLFIINEHNKCVASSLINDSLNIIECRDAYHYQWSSTYWSFSYAFAYLVY